MAGFLYIIQTGFYNRKRPQSQKVHLDQSDRLHEVTVILSRHQTFPFRWHNWDMFRQRVTTDQNTTSVYPRLPHGTFQNFRQMERFCYQRVRGLPFFFQIRILLVSLLQRDFRGFRHHLCQPVCLRQIQLQHPCHILNRHLGSHTTESHDVRHLIRPVFLCNPLQHPLTPVIIKVNVNIRQ